MRTTRQAPAGAVVSKSEDEAVRIYVVMARDPADALEMINACTDASTLRTLHKMLTTNLDRPGADHELNAMMASPVKRRLGEIVVASDTGWLIEIQIGARAVWWRAVEDCGRTWTTDACEAVRFARKEDAERVIKGLMRSDPVMPGAVATEHEWRP